MNLLIKKVCYYIHCPHLTVTPPKSPFVSVCSAPLYSTPSLHHVTRGGGLLDETSQWRVMEDFSSTSDGFTLPVTEAALTVGRIVNMN